MPAQHGTHSDLLLVWTPPTRPLRLKRGLRWLYCGRVYQEVPLSSILTDYDHGQEFQALQQLLSDDQVSAADLDDGPVPVKPQKSQGRQWDAA